MHLARNIQDHNCFTYPGPKYVPIVFILYIYFIICTCHNQMYKLQTYDKTLTNIKHTTHIIQQTNTNTTGHNGRHYGTTKLNRGTYIAKPDLCKTSINK